ncbi:multidrug ABC transporter permease [Virgibacillus profundi]|uniref:Multidrug ABC transporter permease n=1 Tax=Virgibacillus profundi TaxID=2024555 RepID=A0A2A2IF63_9BACI|nr:ABC transporter permease [Virgibacillus profundi]PAV29775.1 multidrug ABC transporter permease [Virgibacillus profundi]PXY53947.1 ABC transporter permease [Virgibacillus profundi]
MRGILLAKFKMFIRNPFTFLIFTGMSIGFALLIGGTGGMTTINVPVYAEDNSVDDSIIGDMLDEADAYSFNWISEEEMTEQVSNGKAEVGVLLQEDDFQLLVGVDSPNAAMIENTIRRAYVKKQQQEQILEAANPTTEAEEKTVLEELQSSMESPVFNINTESFSSTDAVVYDNTFHSLFGFTLFFVIYTIAYNVLPILIDKKDGIWDRIILSPVKKWEMYVANLVYSFFEGYLQVLIIFLIFRYWVGVDFNGRFIETLLLLIPYVFAIVALSILLTALMKNAQQFNAVIPIVAVSMAMIGGAYWPIEIVESKILLALSKINPLTYGMEVLNGVAVYSYPLKELLYPISILLLMGVVMIGVGIHLMERRHV